MSKYSKGSGLSSFSLPTVRWYSRVNRKIGYLHVYEMHLGCFFFFFFCSWNVVVCLTNLCNRPTRVIWQRNSITSKYRPVELSSKILFQKVFFTDDAFVLWFHRSQAFIACVGDPQITASIIWPIENIIVVIFVDYFQIDDEKLNLQNDNMSRNIWLTAKKMWSMNMVVPRLGNPCSCKSFSFTNLTSADCICFDYCVALFFGGVCMNTK